MKFVTLALAVAGCCWPDARAQSISSPAAEAAAPGALARIVRWWDDDWTAGWDQSHWRAMASPYTYHYSRSPEHTHVYMLGAERQRSDGFLFGGTLFKNSFGQPSAYGYIGQRWDGLMDREPLFAQLTGGVLYGYKPPFENKVPLNYRGFSPGLVASLGWQFSPQLSAQVNVLGNSALMLQFSADFR